MTFSRGTRMGVDVGNARVGVALCDPDGILATPLKTLRRDLKKDSDLRVLLKLIQVHEVFEIFVGLPKTMKGGDSLSTTMAKEYADKLLHGLSENSLDVPVWMVDERLTSVSAHRSLREAGVSTREHKKMIDQVAAVNILQYSVDAIKSGNAVAGYRLEPSQIDSDSLPTEDVTENPDEP